MTKANADPNTQDLNREAHTSLAQVIFDAEHDFRVACEQGILLSAMIRLDMPEKLSRFEKKAFRVFAGDVGEKLYDLLGFYDQIFDASRPSQEDAA